MSYCAFFFFSFLTAWNGLCQVFKLNLKDPLIFRSLPPASLNLCRDFSGWRRAALRGLRGTRPTPLTQWPEPITKRIGTSRASRPSPFPSPAPSTTSRKEGRRRDVFGMCLQFKSLAFCQPFLNKRQELQWGAKGSLELQWPCDPEIPVSAAFICFRSKRGKSKDGGGFLCYLEADGESELWWVHEGAW